MMNKLAYLCIVCLLIGCVEEINTEEREKPNDDIGLSSEKAAVIHGEHMKTYKDMSLEKLTSLVGTGDWGVNGKKMYSYKIKTTISAEGSEPDFIEVNSVLTEVILDDSKNTRTVSRENLVKCKNASIQRCRN